MNSCEFATVVLLCVVCAARSVLAKEVQDDSHTPQVEKDLVTNVHVGCLQNDSLSCLKYKFIIFADKVLRNQDTIAVTEGVKIIRTEDKIESAPRALSGNATVANLIMYRIQRFLDSHKIEVDIKGSEVINAISSLGNIYNNYLEEDIEDDAQEGRAIKKKIIKKLKKKKAMLKTLLAAAGMQAAVMGKLAYVAVSIIAGKALMVGKIALILSAIIGLRKLLGQQQKRVTFEVLQHPQHLSEHIATHETVYGTSGSGSYGDPSGGHGGWGRSHYAQPLAYSGQIINAVKQ